ncbi:hypothetical protein VV089_16775 [Candidatus Merdisoma sp. JLR.KK011]|uniref:hypothetical protein n=1 Tax=Candidatus Merdisoma sp. JLR.KK011 TaxID=3114299 RepID=UPI002FEF0A35
MEKVMSLHIEETRIEKAIREKDKNSQNNLFFLKENGQFICVDCNDNDWIFPLVINVYGKENTLLHNIEEVYGIELL